MNIKYTFVFDKKILFNYYSNKNMKTFKKKK